jgi:coiled-coil domain-containing protein 12
MSSHETLSAASNDRKARLAQLKSLKRKQAPADEDPAPSEGESVALTKAKSPSPDAAATYLSGRNYDPTTRNAKLGFSVPPSTADPSNTLESRAAALALSSKEAQALEAASATENNLDFAKLQPKKPNWDLKRDLKNLMRERGVDDATENAIARLVRARVEEKQNEKLKLEGSKTQPRAQGGADGEGEVLGMEGSELVEAMHLKEKEEEEERRREEQEAEEDVS